jgi:hypothetical protein
VTCRKRDARECVVALSIADDATAGLRLSERAVPEQTQPPAFQRRALTPDARNRLVDALADVVLADLLHYPPRP